MRLLLLWMVVACERPDVPPCPAVTAVIDDARCVRAPVPRRELVTRSFEVAEDLGSVVPMRAAGFDGYELGHDRDHAPGGMAGWLSPSIVDGTLRLSTYPTSCRDTSAGCSDGDWREPAKVVLEDPVPASACIAYTLPLRRGLAIGVGGELRGYLARDGGGAVVGPRLAVPELAAIEVFDGRGLLQAPDGALWSAVWDGAAPVLARVAVLPDRVRAAVRDNHGVIFAYTDAALYALDERTFAPRWHIDGEVWTVLARDLPPGNDVLTIERTATPRVVVRSLDARGEELRRVTVYEGNVAQAHLERSFERIRPDLSRGVLIVHVAESRRRRGVSARAGVGQPE